MRVDGDQVRGAEPGREAIADPLIGSAWQPLQRRRDRALEAFRVAQIEASSTFNYTPLLAAAVLYLAVTIPMARIVDRLAARDRLLRSAGAPV